MLRKKVLFLCTHNSARSQMAQGILNKKYGNKYKAYSAGTEPTEVNPYAIKAMEELDIDISKHKSKSVRNYLDQEFDYIVTVCDQAQESCPFFPGGGKNVNKNFEDPAAFQGPEEEKIEKFRQVRDQIKTWVENYF